MLFRSNRWSMHELNKVLEQVLVPKANGTQLTVLGGARWESDRFVGSMQQYILVLIAEVQSPILEDVVYFVAAKSLSFWELSE